MNTIITSQTVLNNIAALEAAGKTAWVIATETEILGVYSGRTSAREDKATFAYSGKIVKASELTLTTAPVVAVAPEDKASVAKVKAAGTPRVMISTVERPTKMVWFIADEMQAKNPAVLRKDVIAECVARGIAFLTARTQYQQWFEVQREMAERVAATAAATK